jgi:hypothetical protein
MLNQMRNSKREIAVFITAVVALVVSIAMLTSTVFNNSATISLVSKKYLESSEEQIGKVIVKYLDVYGDEIADSEEVSGSVGDEYSIDAKRIERYILKTSPLNRKGNFDVADQTVNFVYELDTTTINESSDGQNVVVTVLKNKQEDAFKEYKIVVKTVDEDGNAVAGTSYMVTNINNRVERNAIDYTGNFVIGSYVINNVNNDLLKITEVKTVGEYIPLDGTIDLTINKSYDTDADLYSATFTLAEKENVSMTIDEDNKEIVITSVKKLKPAPEEPEEPDQPDMPDLPETGEKIFDLKIEKQIKDVEVNTDGSISRITKKNADELVKIDLPKSKLEKTTLTVTYKIKVTNVGELEGYATGIADYLPERMGLVEGQDIWEVMNDTASLNKHTNTLLKPGDSFEEEITLKIKLTNDDVGTKINSARITSYYNDQGVIDKTPDNLAEEPLLITVKTGEEQVIAVSAVIALISATAIVYVIKKKNSK